MAATAQPASSPLGPAVQHAGRGIAFRIGAMVCMAALSALVKWCGSRGINVFQIIFFRNAFAFVPLGIYIWRTTGFSVLRTQRPLGHLARSTIGISAMVCSFSAVQFLPLTAATAFNFASPLFMTALAALILHEKVGPHRWGAVAVGFIGVLVMVRPAPGPLHPIGAAMAGADHKALTHLIGTGLALLGAAGAAGAMIAVREIGRTERGPTIVFYFTLAGTAVGLVSLPFVWVTPDPATLALLILAGLIGGVGQMLLTEALRVAPVGVVAPFDYTQLIWASLFGFFIWGELPHPATLIGAGIVAASGIYILYRELRVLRGAAPQAA
jgi:drug/metabolite transporter (DMT)-like permease